MTAAFFFCMVGAVYSYFIYPAILMLMTIVHSRAFRATPAARPNSVSVIIAARNEGRRIADKILNTLSLEHPADVEVEILVASDASDDETDRTAQGFADRGVLLVRSPVRNGKEYAQGLAIQVSRGDVIVFTDTGTTLHRNAISQLVDAFADASIGAVSSIDLVVDDSGVVHGEGLYVRYEMALRDLESAFFSLVGLSGSFFSARRVVCQDWDTSVPSDFGTALNCVRLGLRAISSRRVIGYYKNIADPRREYQRKVRTVLRGMTGLRRRSDILNPLRFGRFAFEVFSHKVMRWAVPWFLATAFILIAALARESLLCLGLALTQLVFYCLPLLAKRFPSILRNSLARLCVFFVEVNVAIAHATVLMILGRTALTWEPSRR